MAGSLNKVMIIGRLGKDPEVRYTKDGSAVANLRVATTETWNDKSGERQEKTEWHSVVLWGRQAEIAEQYLQKGRLVYVEGRIETRKWQDQSGADRYTTEIRANNFQMLDRGEGGGGERAERGGGGPRRDSGNRGPAGPRPEPSAPDDMGGGPPPDEDDIPF